VIDILNVSPKYTASQYKNLVDQYNHDDIELMSLLANLAKTQNVIAEKLTVI
jgi:hypothetical protein